MANSAKNISKASFATELSVPMTRSMGSTKCRGVAWHDGEMASLLERLQADLASAMKAGLDTEKSTLRMAIAAVKNAAVAGDAVVTLTDEQVLAVLQAEAKKRAEAADIYKGAGRTEAEASERAELVVLERYLPARLSDDELAAIIAEEVASAAAQGATGAKGMGQVVKAVRAKVGSGADGAAIAALVKQALG